MALTENRYVNSITVKPESSSVEVQWKNQILRDGVEISFTYDRKAYQKRTFTNQKGEQETIDTSSEFLAEVEGAQAYMDILGW